MSGKVEVFGFNSSQAIHPSILFPISQADARHDVRSSNMTQEIRVQKIPRLACASTCLFPLHSSIFTFSLVKVVRPFCDFDKSTDDAGGLPMTSRLPLISEDVELHDFGRNARIENPRACEPHNDALRFIGWAVFSSLSAQYAKYILVDKNFHYPFYLINRVYLIVLGAGLLRNGARFAWSDKWSKRREQKIWRRWAAWIARNNRGASDTQDKILLHGAAGLSAVSVLFWFQALLHFENLITLIFISVPLNTPCQKMCHADGFSSPGFLLPTSVICPSFPVGIQSGPTDRSMSCASGSRSSS